VCAGRFDDLPGGYYGRLLTTFISQLQLMLQPTPGNGSLTKYDKASVTLTFDLDPKMAYQLHA